ncbi:hypothetical protein [Tepidimonas taiwanensis]|uniref:hypothetical protein n=1 Tax=Tepidimonas taiwanensis TaxID=307486 RepID=UPI0021B10CD8|nr:hypothetical protein [Tepidimonas taiwanensis]
MGLLTSAPRTTAFACRRSAKPSRRMVSSAAAAARAVAAARSSRVFISSARTCTKSRTSPSRALRNCVSATQACAAALIAKPKITTVKVTKTNRRCRVMATSIELSSARQPYHKMDAIFIICIVLCGL